MPLNLPRWLWIRNCWSLWHRRTEYGVLRTSKSTHLKQPWSVPQTFRPLAKYTPKLLQVYLWRCTIYYSIQVLFYQTDVELNYRWVYRYLSPFYHIQLNVSIFEGSSWLTMHLGNWWARQNRTKILIGVFPIDGENQLLNSIHIRSHLFPGCIHPWILQVY